MLFPIITILRRVRFGGNGGNYKPRTFQDSGGVFFGPLFTGGSGGSGVMGGAGGAGGPIVAGGAVNAGSPTIDALKTP